MHKFEKVQLEKAVEHFWKESPLNHVKSETEEFDIFEMPILGYGASSDSIFESYLEPQVIGEHFRLPGQWLPEAATVISFFLPFSEAVRKSNRVKNVVPSEEWLYGRIEGQQFVAALSEFLVQLLKENGEEAIAPSLSKKFWTVSAPEEGNDVAFTSNWSERHVAYACGLGTFGLSKGLITKRGMAGRFGSVVTSWKTEPTPRTYVDIYEDCIRCGVCIKRCPGGAISLEEGKNHYLCYQYQKTILDKCLPRYGCGFCQTGVPCEKQQPFYR